MSFGEGDDDDESDFVEETVIRLLEEFADGEQQRCRKLFRIVAGHFVDRFDPLQLAALTLIDEDIRNKSALWHRCMREFDRRAEDDFDDDERIGYLNRLCLMSIHDRTTFNRDSAKLLLRATHALELTPEAFLDALRSAFPDSRHWR